MQPKTMIPYEIHVVGPLSDRWDGLILESLSIISHCGAITTLRVEVPDTAALRGLINHFWDLNLEIILLKQIQPRM
jgi:hypothetical protein